MVQNIFHAMKRLSRCSWNNRNVKNAKLILLRATEIENINFRKTMDVFLSYFLSCV